MKIQDYSIVQGLFDDKDFMAFLQEKGYLKSIPMVVHYLSENYGYAQWEAYNFARTLLDELSTRTNQ